MLLRASKATMKVLQINAVVNTTSTGRIAEEIGQVLLQHGHESYIAYGRRARKSESRLIKIGSTLDTWTHAAKSFVLDSHGLGSKKATQQFMKMMFELQPDVVVLHNIHGYYIHYPTLFDGLKKLKVPVIWTLYDCWAFTGHCAYYDLVDCKRWQTECHNCPNNRKYPISFGIDQSIRNFRLKKEVFNGLPNLAIVTHSKWLAGELKNSFLRDIPVSHIFNGTNLEIFKPVITKKELSKNPIVLGVASIWSIRKGLNDFFLLRECLHKDYRIILIGLSRKQIKQLPPGIEGIERTESLDELVEWYNNAAVFVNPTYEDNFPTTNIEALACGTPVITYDTGGSPEAVDEKTGRVVAKGDIGALKQAIVDLASADVNAMQLACRQRAERYFNKNDRYIDYLNLFESTLSKRIRKSRNSSK